MIVIMFSPVLGVMLKVVVPSVMVLVLLKDDAVP
jgi:hypothetical protein